MGTQPRFTRFLFPLFSLFLLLLVASPVQAIDNPELLPDHPTPVIDLAHAFSDNQLKELETSLDAFEQSSSVRMAIQD